MTTKARMLAIFSVIVVLLLGACESDRTPVAEGSMQVVEQEKGSGREDTETIYLDNCDGKANITQVAERGQTVQIDTGVDLGVSIEVIQAAVSGSYATGSFTSKTIQLTAPPGTNMFFRLKWTMTEQVGIVTNAGTKGESIGYRRFAPIDVQIVEQGDLGNCGSSAVGEALSPTSEPVPMAPVGGPTTVPMPTEEPTAVPMPTTPPLPSGPILNAGETWTQDGVALTLQKADIQPDRIDAQFVLENKTDSQLLFYFGLESFIIRDNLGNLGNVWVFNRCVPQISVCYSGVGDTSLGAGQSLQINMEFSGLSLTKTQVDSVFVTIKEISRIKDVSWRVTIPH